MSDILPSRRFASESRNSKLETVQSLLARSGVDPSRIVDLVTSSKAKGMIEAYKRSLRRFDEWVVFEQFSVDVQ